MPGTPPLGPAALPRVLATTRPARWALLILLVLAVPAAVAAASARAQSCPAASAPVGTAPSATVKAAVLCLVNAERAKRGLAAVDHTAALELTAQRHASDMVARRYFAHVSPSGGNVEKRARRAGYLTAPCYVLGEDLGWAPPDVATPEAVVAAWMASPSHRSVILDGEFREGGVGLVARAPTGDGSGATFVLELGAMVRCEPPSVMVRAVPRARVRAS